MRYRVLPWTIVRSSSILYPCTFVSKGDLDLKNKIEVMELSDLHHPSCKLNQSRQGSFEDDDIEPADLDEDMDDDRCVHYPVDKEDGTQEIE